MHGVCPWTLCHFLIVFLHLFDLFSLYSDRNFCLQDFFLLSVNLCLILPTANLFVIPLKNKNEAPVLCLVTKNNIYQEITVENLQVFLVKSSSLVLDVIISCFISINNLIKVTNHLKWDMNENKCCIVMELEREEERIINVLFKV